MRGRYTLTVSLDALKTFLATEGHQNLAARHNVAPTQEAPVIRLGEDGVRRIVQLRWVLVPAWAKDLSFAANAINARAESVTEKPTFRDAVRRRLCLVPADGYFEWVVTGKAKQPCYFTLETSGIMVFAGLCERWAPAGAEPVETFGFVTVDASPDVTPVHDRMPVLLDSAGTAAWLDPKTPQGDLQKLLTPAPAGRLVHPAVSTAVNSARAEGPELIRRVEPAQPRLL